MTPSQAIKVNIFTFFTQTIIYAPCLPGNFAFCFQFLLDITVIPREILNIKKNVDAKFWGQTRCIVVYVKMVNRQISIMILLCICWILKQHKTLMTLPLKSNWKVWHLYKLTSSYSIKSPCHFLVVLLNKEFRPS